ncbi:MAG TPA: hypothetical protein VE955_09490, partial [Candidatus Dormibacteraeota bacterium]|nr:hypothetical protein [Candidatus Dormibacteraeota bacterium]
MSGGNTGQKTFAILPLMTVRLSRLMYIGGTTCVVPNELDEFGDPVVVLSYRPQVNKQHNFEEEQQRHLPVH